MGIEREWKFKATPELLDEMERGAMLEMRKEKKILEMETTYLDTAERDFAERKWTLRVRRENGMPVVTLKTPAASGARGEWEHPGDKPDAEKLLSLGAPEAIRTLLQKTLEPTCGARFTRRAIELDSGAGWKAELALDKGILFREDRTAPLCEVEVEHKDGLPEGTEMIATILQMKYGLEPEPESKHRRAMKL